MFVIFVDDVTAENTPKQKMTSESKFGERKDEVVDSTSAIDTSIATTTVTTATVTTAKQQHITMETKRSASLDPDDDDDDDESQVL